MTDVLSWFTEQIHMPRWVVMIIVWSALMGTNQSVKQARIKFTIIRMTRKIINETKPRIDNSTGKPKGIR